MSKPGLNFAQSQLEKYGWSQGKGLGLKEEGITEALKPKLKFNSAGLGYDLGEQFKFHWWDHVFNKAADNLSVRKAQDGSVQLKRTENLEVSTKRPSLSSGKSKVYSNFVKGGTLVGQEEKAKVDTSNEEEERDRSLKLSDDELFRICKGRTAHKGARHGLNMTAKLARVREQELLLMQEWGAAEPQGQDNSDQLQPKKKKKKKSGKDKNVNVTVCAIEPEVDNVVKHKKAKNVDVTVCAIEPEVDNVVKHKKRKSKKGGSSEHEGKVDTVLEHEQTHEIDKAKKREEKKKRKRDRINKPVDCDSELCIAATQTKKKRKKCMITVPQS